MGIEDLRARQRQTIMRSQLRQLGLDYLRSIEMKPENIERIRAAHPEHFHPSVGDVPDGWTDVLMSFLVEFRDLGEGMMSPGDVRFERTNSGLKAYVWPNSEMQWSPEKAQAVVGLQRHLYMSSRDLCEWCGKGDAVPVPLGERVTFFLCEEHKASAEAKLAAQIAAFDERVRFRDEMSVLFRPMSCMSIQVSDHNLDIMRKALRDIKKIVEERELIGKVYVTKVMESEGQLFISARCGQADPATQFEIADIVKHAEWESDQAQLAANKEDRDHDA
ncbi:hypothetical protein HJA87_31150 [Rhizobium bangladeshense]|uniref:Uncharacterized protein n=1 Tax=Rhizobium bangladeshense TaxID=1138189 RepID=A0ABS7LSH8_9HYPH|nr:hypothetical protein [Rhizobium bangladeshense]MBY3594260.1 hypothetical protein [Rhizobium bangladeshense]